MDKENKEITMSDILAAQNKIQHVICKTPLKPSYELSILTGKNVWLKLENMQPTGAFKIRGAANKILSLSAEQRAAGVITTSSGNHGRAMAYLAKELGVRAVVCMTEVAPKQKIENIKKLGAEVIIQGRDQNQSTDNALRVAMEQGLTFIPPFDDPDIIAGQGTVGLEILNENPEIDTLIVQVSGGGLISGVALTARSINPNIKIIGVTSEEGAAIYESIKAGKIVDVDEPVSIADALPGPIPFDNQYTFAMCRDLVDEIIKVSDSEVEKAMVHALLKEKIVLEGGGAASIALLMKIEKEKLGNNVALVCSGDNVNPERIIALVNAMNE